MSKNSTEPQRKTSSRQWCLVGISCLFLVLPFLFISFPPSTDLPQHMSQIHLLLVTLKGGSELYSIEWYAPNNLIYLLLAGTWLLLSPALSGKITLMVLLLLWAGAIFLLASKRSRPFENAVLASILVFNFAVYWGFLNFIIGWPFFVLWLIQSLKPIDKKGWLLLVILSVLLYCSHAMWFLLGSVWLLAYIIFQWNNWKSAIYRISSLVPIAVAALVWYPNLASVRATAGFDVAPHWLTLPFQRLLPSYLVDSMFGGIKGYLEPVISFAILGWIILATYSNRRNLKEKIDSQLLLCSAIFIAMMLFAPDKYMNTIFFSQRWFPCGIILLLIALPKPNLNKNLILVVAVALLAVFSIATTKTWYVFEQRELSGLEDSLQEIPEKQRVLGLDFAKTSIFLKGRPFLQTFAYAQAFSGAELNFSFAEHSSGIVRYKRTRKVAWTLALDWNAEWAKHKDLQRFDYILVNGNAEVHSKFLSFPYLRPITLNGCWRLYRVIS